MLERILLKQEVMSVNIFVHVVQYKVLDLHLFASAILRVHHVFCETHLSFLCITRTLHTHTHTNTTHTCTERKLSYQS